MGEVCGCAETISANAAHGIHMNEKSPTRRSAAGLKLPRNVGSMPMRPVCIVPTRKLAPQPTPWCQDEKP